MIINLIKSTLIAIVFATSFTKVAAQEYPAPLVIEGKSTDAQYGVAKDMVYETILETNLSKKELITRISAGLIENGFLDPKDLKLDKITDKQTRFVITGGFKGGTFAGKGKSVMAKRLKSPVVLGFDIVFDFYESGKVKMQFTNYQEAAFIRVNDQGQFHYEPSMGSMLNPSTQLSDERHKKLVEIEQRVMKTGTVFGKAVSFIEKGKASAKITVGANGISIETQNGIKDDFKKLRVSIAEEWKVLDQAEKDKVAIWIDPANPHFLDLYQTVNEKQKKMKEQAASRIGENVLLVVDNDRFEKYFKDLFNQMFVWSAAEILAQNFTIAKDGKVLYTANENYELKEVKK